MDVSSYKEYLLTDIADIESTSDKEYPEGTLILNMSAISSTPIEDICYLTCGRISDRRGVAIILKDSNMCMPRYFEITVKNSLPEFINKYKQNINLSKDTLKHLKVCIHDKETQEFIVDVMEHVDALSRQAERELNTAKDLKKYLLNRMMI